jgi:hypothetical protein
LRRRHESNVAFTVTTRQTCDDDVAFFALVVVCPISDFVNEIAIILFLGTRGKLTDSGDTEFSLGDISACGGE